MVTEAKMGRCRDDVPSSRAEWSGQYQNAGGSNVRRLTTSDALTFLKLVRTTFRDRKDNYYEFVELMKDFRLGRVDFPGVITRVKQLFVGHQRLLLGFNIFLPEGYDITLTPEEGPLVTKKQVHIDDALSFIEKIKAKLQGYDHVSKSFLRILNMYKMEKKSISEVYQEVSELFRDHPDLLSEFALFLPYDLVPATINYSQTGRDSGRGVWHPPMSVLESDGGSGVDKHDSEFEMTLLRSNNDQSTNVDKVKRDIREQGCDEQDLGYNGEQHELCNRKSAVDQVIQVHQCGDDTTMQHVLCNRKSSVDQVHQCGDGTKNNVNIKDYDRERGAHNKDNDGREQHIYDRGVTIFSQEVSGKKLPIDLREKSMQKSIQELDLSDCESCTPNYRLLPKDYLIPTVSQRTDIGAEVLNDHWVSFSSASEDYPFNHMRENQYEESLFQCEDDRFEMDMLLELVTSTIRRVEELLGKITNITISTNPPIRIEDHFTALNLRCIERLYGDHGLDVMDVLQKNASVALPVILTRLKQKQDEWAKCRSEFNKIWAETYSKYHHKSLDHTKPISSSRIQRGMTKRSSSRIQRA